MSSACLQYNVRHIYLMFAVFQCKGFLSSECSVLLYAWILIECSSPTKVIVAECIYCHCSIRPMLHLPFPFFFLHTWYDKRFDLLCAGCLKQPWMIKVFYSYITNAVCAVDTNCTYLKMFDRCVKWCFLIKTAKCHLLQYTAKMIKL